MPKENKLPALHSSAPRGATQWTLYASNEEAWEQMLIDCARAKVSIDLEQYIFYADDFGRKLIDICAERAAAGVRVRFLWDAAGSFSLWGQGMAEELARRGIELIFWKTLIPPYFKVPNFRSWFLRNHRRTLVIDGSVGYTGSICIQDRMKNWRDTNVRLEGPVVVAMASAFTEMWTRAMGRRVSILKSKVRTQEFSYQTNFPIPGRRHLYRNIVEAIRAAKHYIYITTPYFIPTHRMARVLRLAARRGVDVRLIIPEKSDYYAIDIAGRSYFQNMLASGVRIFLYSGNMIHSKTMTIDGDWSTVGSLNLDSVSLLYNFEANIVTTNTLFAEELSAHFVRDLQDCREVGLNEWRARFFLEKIPEWLIKLVRKFL